MSDQTFDGINHVVIGDPTEKADYDQQIDNANALKAITGRVLAQGGLPEALTDWTAYAPMPASYEFNLPARAEVGGITIRLASTLAVENASITGYIALQYFDGLVWQLVANSEVTLTQVSAVYLESANLQNSLHTSATRYRFVTKISTTVGGYRMSGMAFLAVS